MGNTHSQIDKIRKGNTTVKLDDDKHFKLSCHDDGDSDVLMIAEGRDELQWLHDSLSAFGLEESSYPIENPYAEIQVFLLEGAEVYFQSVVPYETDEQEALQDAIYTLVYGMAAWNGLYPTYECEPPKPKKS